MNHSSSMFIALPLQDLHAVVVFSTMFSHSSTRSQAGGGMMLAMGVLLVPVFFFMETSWVALRSS